MRQRPISVTIFGILNIGFGLLGIILTVVHVFIIPNMPSLNLVTESGAAAAWTKISTPLDGVASVLLIAVGIGLLLLQKWARTGSLIYGIYAIVVALINLIVVVAGNLSPLMKVAGSVGVILTLIYPILLIVFMLRPNVVAAFNPVPPLP